MSSKVTCAFCGGSNGSPLNPSDIAQAELSKEEWGHEVARAKVRILAKRKRKWPRLRLEWS
jgi:hypothetical protein